MSKRQKLISSVLFFVLLGLLAVGGYWGYQMLTRPLPTEPAPSCVTQNVGDKLLSSQVTVRVYNGGTISGQASAVGKALKAAGFQVPTIGNWPGDEPILETVIIGANPDDPEVLLVLGFFPDGVARGDGRADHTVDVVFGDTFTGLNAEAPTEIAVPGGTVCLPSPTATPTPTETPAEGEGAEGAEGEPTPTDQPA